MKELLVERAAGYVVSFGDVLFSEIVSQPRLLTFFMLYFAVVSRFLIDGVSSRFRKHPYHQW